MRPYISIIVPVYNVEEYISDCIESILSQTFTNIELILVNDGSEDKSGEICDTYAKKDSRIQVIHKSSQGVSAARNIGLKESSGRYIGFVDSDDYIDKDMYKKMYELCIDKDCEIAICKLGREIDGEIINKTEDEFIKVMDNQDAMSELFKGILYRFSLCNKLFKKECFKDVEFPEGRIHEDLSTTYKVFANASKSVYINYVGYIYVKRNNSILTKKFYEKRLDAFIGWDEILQFMKKRYLQIYDQVIACFVYYCIDNIYYIFNQVEEKIKISKYIRIITNITYKYKKDIYISKLINYKYKSKVFLINTNIWILYNNYNIKKVCFGILGK